MGNRMFLIKTEYDERALSEAIESEVRELGESPLYGCGFFCKGGNRVTNHPLLGNRERVKRIEYEIK